LTGPFEELAQAVRHKILNLAGAQAGAEEFRAFHEQFNEMYSMFSPSGKVWIEGAVREFNRLHGVTQPLQVKLVEEIFWFGHWANQHQAELYMPLRTDD